MRRTRWGAVVGGAAALAIVAWPVAVHLSARSADAAGTVVTRAVAPAQPTRPAPTPTPTGPATTRVTRGDVTVSFHLDRTRFPTETFVDGRVTVTDTGSARRYPGCVLSWRVELLPAGQPPDPVDRYRCFRGIVVRHGTSTYRVEAIADDVAGPVDATLLSDAGSDLPIPAAIPVEATTTGALTTVLRLRTTRVRAGVALHGDLVSSNHTHHAIRIDSCALGDTTYGLRARDGLVVAPLSGLVYCRAFELAPGRRQFPIEIETTYGSCVNADPTMHSPRCGRSPAILALPPGRYETDVPLFGFPAGTTPPAPVAVTLTS